ncbi:MAG: hypothetical protein IJX41_08420 [Bacteroidaceae bacterium]|nr:hypothetical protein [Bacteroidaceae bacterium]
MEKRSNLNAQANVNFDCKSTSNYTETADMTPKNDYQYDRKCKRDVLKTIIPWVGAFAISLVGGVIGCKYIDARYSAQPVKA